MSDDQARLVGVEGSDRQVNLDGIGRHISYLASELPDGTVVLTPAVVMTVENLVALVGEAEAAAIAERERDRVMGMPWAADDGSPPRR